MIITDKKIIQKIVKNINEINQIFKNIYNSDSEYYFIKNKILSTSNLQLPHIVLGSLKNTNIKEVDSFFNNYTFKIEGKPFFNFLKVTKSTKDDIKEITIENKSYIEFKSSLYNIKFSIIKEELDEKIKFYKKYIDTFDYKYLENVKLDTCCIDRILNQKNIPQRFIIDLDNEEVVIDNNRKNDTLRESYIEITLSEKFILGLKIKKLKKGNVYTDTFFNLYGSNEKEEVFCIMIQVNNSLFTIKQYYIVIDVA